MPEGSTLNIKQGYLIVSRHKQLRVRIINGQSAFLCYKQDLGEDVKHEYEYEIPLSEGLELYDMAPSKLSKTRLSTMFDGNKIDIDDFGGGLVIVEVEIGDILKPLLLPPYCGKNVTGMRKYTNIAIAK